MAVDVMAQLRLDKYLADMGIGTRSQIKEAAKKGRIQVNGQTEKKTDRKITPGDDQVIMDGQVIGYVGSTGESTGPHLHIGISYNGVYLDPQGYLTYQDPQETTAPGS